MNKEQFAELINGRQYRDEITEEEKLVKEKDLLQFVDDFLKL